MVKQTLIYLAPRSVSMPLSKLVSYLAPIQVFYLASKSTTNVKLKTIYGLMIFTTHYLFPSFFPFQLKTKNKGNIKKVASVYNFYANIPFCQARIPISFLASKSTNECQIKKTIQGFIRLTPHFTCFHASFHSSFLSSTHICFFSVRHVCFQSSFHSSYKLDCDFKN